MSDRVAFYLTGRRTLLIFVAFFGVVFVVNGIFAYYAEHTFSGLAAEDAYRKGLAYNDVLARADAQRALGWHAGLTVEDGRPVLRLTDSKEQPLNGREVKGVARRPLNEREDRPIQMVWTGDGVYTAKEILPERGQWDVRLEVARKNAEPYLIEQRLWRK